MLFGVCNSIQILSRLIYGVISSRLKDRVFIYFDVLFALLQVFNLHIQITRARIHYLRCSLIVFDNRVQFRNMVWSTTHVQIPLFSTSKCLGMHASIYYMCHKAYLKDYQRWWNEHEHTTKYHQSLVMLPYFTLFGQQMITHGGPNI